MNMTKCDALFLIQYCQLRSNAITALGTAKTALVTAKTALVYAILHSLNAILALAKTTKVGF